MNAVIFEYPGIIHEIATIVNRGREIRFIGDNPEKLWYDAPELLQKGCPMTINTCPCGSGRDYENCCGPYLSGETQAPDPERLMRSRYTAFCRKDAGYLLASQAQDHRGPEALRKDLDRTMATTRWLGLRVMGAGMDGPDRGWVEFVAFFSQEGETGQLHELSRFLKREGRWIYQSGEILPAVKLGRNDPCFCGSGKKFKKCHGKGNR